MAGWLDRMARRAAESSRPAPARQPPPEPRQPLTRRQLLTRGAVAGTAVWAAPVLQTVMAPAASASGIGNPGDACTSGAQCGSGICLSNHTCAPSSLYGQCATNADCAAIPATCVATGSAGGSVCVKNYPGSGSNCAANADCSSGSCTGTPKTCKTVSVPSACHLDRDCVTGWCSGGTCQKVNAGGTCAANGDCTSASCTGNPKTCAKRSFNGTCGANVDCYTGNVQRRRLPEGQRWRYVQHERGLHHRLVQRERPRPATSAASTARAR